MNELESMMERYPQLICCKEEIKMAVKLLDDTFNRGGKVLIAGNGGSACDAGHIAGELMKAFRLKRKIGVEMARNLKKIDLDYGNKLCEKLQDALPALSLSSHEGLMTAIGNDTGYDMGFAQQLYGLGKEEDTFWAISTSGNSDNINLAAVTAKALKMKVIGLTGVTGGDLKKFCDCCICVPERETSRIQELHLPIYHIICILLEQRFFGIN